MKDPKDMSFNELFAELGDRLADLQIMLSPEGRMDGIRRATAFNQKYSAACGVYASFCDGRLENVE